MKPLCAERWNERTLCHLKAGHKGEHEGVYPESVICWNTNDDSARYMSFNGVSTKMTK